VSVLDVWWEDSFDPRRVEGFIEAMQTRWAPIFNSPV
jgi:hypothetical protein